MSQPALEARDVSVVFFGLHALSHVSLTVTPGEIVGLIGPNGSGKTTLINALTGQVPLAGGQIRVDGKNVTALAPRLIARKGVARSFQIVRLFDKLTVAENVTAAALAQGHKHAHARQKAAAALAYFGLSKRADDMAATLSYGDKRRVEIARALCAEPRYLLLDEPAAGMNDIESDQLLSILSALPQERNLGLLIIDHDMPLIMRLCQRLHVLASGQTIAEGDAASVRAHPAVIEAYLGSSAHA